MKYKTGLIVLTIFALATLSCSLISDLFGQKNNEVPQAPTASGGEPPAAPPQSKASPPAEGVAPSGQVPSRVRPADGMVMVFIPAGEFLMGSDTSAFRPERPQHAVTLDEYWIDQTEVSNAQYRLCAESGVCSEPKAWNDPNFSGDDQPILVSWQDAQTYCQWVGAHLPTEAEWEKAARGTDGRTWPWGNEFEAGRANLSSKEDGFGFTAPVGSFPNDVSPYGLLDVAGNAAEWVADWYDAEYYAHSPAQNPSGPVGGEQKVYRGTIANAGGGPEKCRCTARYAGDVNLPYGFRCVSSTPPDEQAVPPPSSDDAAKTPPAEMKVSPSEEGETSPPEEIETAPVDTDWTDFPVFPGATLIGEAIEIPADYKTNYDNVGVRGFETESNVEEVASFYLDEMPGFGWEKIMHMPMGSDSYISVWQQGNGAKGATITVGKRQDGLTHIGNIKAAGPR